MAFDYVQARQDALEIISEFGEAGQVILKGATGGGYDSSGNPQPATPDITIDGIITPLLDYDNSEINGTSVLSTDSYVYFHSDTNPIIGMQSTLNGVTYRVMGIDSLSSVGDIRVYTKLQLRV